MERYLDEQEIIDDRNAILTCILANANLDTKKRHSAFKVKDFKFMPSRRKNPQKKETSEDQKREHYRILNASMGGKEIKDG